jgi:hypothetical protein
MHQAVVYVDPTGAAPIGFAQAAGMPGDIRFDFKTQTGLAYPDIVDLYPQLVLRPFTQTQISAYDIVINDPTGASGIATVPGSVMNDRFSAEVYSRNSIGQPQKMLAVGRIDLTGYGYISNSPLSPAAATIGPSGPAGPQGSTGAQGPTGIPGERGSRWYTGAGPPSGLVPDTRVDGDMWLDESNGDVWRWSATFSTWLTFKGV